jgi:hypothetical protein
LFFSVARWQIERPQVVSNSQVQVLKEWAVRAP